MKVYLFIPLLFAACTTERQNESSLRKIDSVDFSHVRIQDKFWSPRLDKHKTATLPVCIDQIENQTGRMQNFENAALGTGAHSGIFFDDSDVYKALEGIAYSLINNPDPELEQKADEWIDKFAAAQQPDGYLNTYYILTDPSSRWTNMDKHEMYCAGHMIEAAVAYYQATGKTKLLDVCTRKVDHMMDLFGPEKTHWVPGHEEIELALVKLSEATGKPEYLDFAYWLLEERGRGHGTTNGEGNWDVAYYQDIVPVRELTDISGHAVRSMYLYCGMADVAAMKNDTGYIAALDRLWDDVVLRNMYITGGIGSSRQNEGFTEDYDLPNLEAYCETCASVGMVLWNQRMNQFTGDSKYIDVLERSMYNGALAGISLDGDRFFYVNPLESTGNHHRKEWYGCACCPSQISRFLPSIGNYIYGISDDALWVNLYIGNETTFPVDGKPVTLIQETDYPWDGNIRLTVQADQPVKKQLKLRLPDWCNAYSLTVNGEAGNNQTAGNPAGNNRPDHKNKASALTDKGYLVIGSWKPGDVIELNLAMPTELVAADPRVKQNAGKRAVQRGPLVYCVEEQDNAIAPDDMLLTDNTRFSSRFEPELLGGITVIEASDDEQNNITFIPYYSWDNRESGRMKVWIDKQ